MRCLNMQTVSSGHRPALAAGRQRTVTVRAMDALRKPELKRPEPPKKLFTEEHQQAAAEPAVAPQAAAPSVTKAAEPSTTGEVTIEYQRQRAKAMRQYFQDKQLEAAVQKSQVFGWTPANEIGNGRWVMFGIFVGLLTEYATGVNFPDQIGLLLSYLGIVDLE